jgi:hypothetical protein
MEQLNSYADSRLIAACIHCGARTETRDHCPPRVLLDEPYPENLPVVPACSSCNGGLSLDEEYFACLVECARTGSIEAVQRPKIRRIFMESPALAARLRNARQATADGQTSFSTEGERIKAVALKLARGHAAFELSELSREEPSHIMIVPLQFLTPDARRHFETPPPISGWPEVGSRAMQRMFVAGDAFSGPGWIDVREGQYRYLAVAEGAVLVRFVVGEYLACEIMWREDES